MEMAVPNPTRSPRYGWVFAAIQLLLVATYVFAAVAFLTTDAQSFPEQSPPLWSWPAVIVVGIGWLPAFVCVPMTSWALLYSEVLRGDRRQWTWLLVSGAAYLAMLFVMGTPPGQVLFDWFVA